MLATDVPELIYGNPLLLAGLAAVLVLLVNYQKGLSYREVVVLSYLKVGVFAALDAVASRYGRSLATEAHDEDYLTTLDVPPRTIVRKVRPPAQPNLTSTAKYRTANDDAADRQWAHSQWAIRYDRDGEPWQTHVYLFTNPDGSTDVYAHVERSVTDPEGHTEGKQINGDHHQRVADAYTGGNGN